MRSQNHKNLIKGLTHHCKELLEASGFAESKQLQDKAKNTLQFTLHVLQDVVVSVTDEQVTKTKVILYQSIQDMIHLTLTILSVYTHQPGNKMTID